MRRHHPDALTAREREVLALIRLGLTNEEIAQRLDISLAGAKYHVSQILSKLGVATREQAAATPVAEAFEPRRPAWWARLPLWAKIAGAATVVAGVGAVAAVTLVALSNGRSDSEEQPGQEAVINDNTACTPDQTKLTGPSELAVGRLAGTVCWLDSDGEAAYRVIGWVDYWPDCEAWRARLPPQRVDIDESLPPDTSDFEFPSTPDPRFPEAKEWEVSVQAIDADGALIAQGGRAFIKELDYSTC